MMMTNNNAFGGMNMNGMNGGYFNQPQQFGMGTPVPQQPGFINQGGNTFNPMTSAIRSSTSDEDLAKIRQLGGAVAFDFTEEERLRAAWDFRDGTTLALELLDPQTQRVRAKYTGEEFNLVLVDDVVVEEALDLIHNIVCSTKVLNERLSQEKSKEMYTAFGVLNKMLPIAYKEGRKNYNNIFNTSKNQVGNNGYLGYNGLNAYNGMYGQVPNFIMNNGSVPPMMQNQMMGYAPQQQYSPEVMAAAQQLIAAQQQPPTINGGTMLNGNNPFVQNGQQQVITPPQQSGPVVPPPGTPVQQQANPAIGAAVQQTTTASAPF